MELSQEPEDQARRFRTAIAMADAGIEMMRAPHVEVVLLFAESEGELHRTHPRYFGAIGAAVRSLRDEFNLSA